MERDHLKDIGCDGKTLLKWILKKWDGEAWTGLLWLVIGTGGGFSVNAVMNFGVPYNSGNFLIRRETVSFSRRALLLELSYYSCNEFQNRLLSAEYEMPYFFYIYTWVRAS